MLIKRASLNCVLVNAQRRFLTAEASASSWDRLTSLSLRGLKTEHRSTGR